MSVENGQLLRWTGDDGEAFGVITDADANRVRVRMDSGEELTFAWPSEVLSPVEYAAGESVSVLGRDDVGVVVEASEINGVRFYGVALPGNQRLTVKEDGLRPALFSDPIQRLEAGQFDSARSTNLRLAATRLLLAHQYDELSALSNSRVEIKPHQVAVVHRVATAYPHRFILADEVGLGKTVEAGLLIKELKARGVANRVLVIAPSGIVSQWQFELKTKFNEVFAHYNRDTIRFLENETPGENVWALRDNVIVSSSFAAWDEQRRGEIALAGWDMVVIDEAHHVRRTWQGESRFSETNLFRLADMLADPQLSTTQAFLLLSATPMQLHPFELYSLVELLDPTLFPSYSDFENHTQALADLNVVSERVRTGNADRASTAVAVARWLDRSEETVSDDLGTAEGRADLVAQLAGRHRLSEVLIRNRKKTVGGFQPRVAAIWEVDLTPAEYDAYWATTEYVRAGYAQSRATQNNALGFLMSTFQKLNASSSFALQQSLTRRIERLRGELGQPRPADEFDEADLEERYLDDALGDALAARHAEALDKEIDELTRLVGLLDAIPVDSKTLVLLAKLQDLLDTEPGVKVLIFTQFRATQDYLRSSISEPWNVRLFHGQLSPGEKDAAVRAFREGEGPQILISTEAGGEGRNLQFCHILVNYDLPWNPMKVEQRIGRVDRIGQLSPVTVFNFSTRGTIEERVVDVLTERIGVFQQTIGGLDPILGDVESDLKKIFMLAETEAAKALENLDKTLEDRVQEALAAEGKLSDLIMDTKSLRKDEVERLLQRRQDATNEDMRRFVVCALSELDVKVFDDPTSGVYQIRFGDRFKELFPQLVKEGMSRRATFEPSVALQYEDVEFLAFGHELVDALVARVRDSSYAATVSYRCIQSEDIDPTTGWFLVYELELGGLAPKKELLPVFVSTEGETDLELGAALLALSARGRLEEFDSMPPPAPRGALAPNVDAANRVAIEHLIKSQTEMQGVNRERIERERERLEQFYDYRARAAQTKLEATRQTFERLSQSTDLDVQRILPVWAKNLENARRTVSTLDHDRQRRLGELAGRDHVTAHHGLTSASYIEIYPDPRRLVRAVDPAASKQVVSAFRRCCRRVTSDELASYRGRIVTRRDQLNALRAGGHQFDLAAAREVADGLLALIDDVRDAGSAERFVAAGAVEYFFLIDDGDNDVKAPHGFDDDRLVYEAARQYVDRAEMG